MDSVVNVSGPHWIILIVCGGIVGYLVQLSFPLIGREIYSYFSTSPFVDYKYSYHKNLRDGQFYISENNIRIKKQTSKSYSYNSISFPNEEYNYAGKMRETQGHLLVVLDHKEKDFKDTVVLRFEILMAKNNYVLPGICLSIDNNKNIASGPILLSKDRLSMTQFDSILDKYIRVDKKNKFLNITRV